MTTPDDTSPLDAEITAVRAKIAARPPTKTIAESRQRLDVIGESCSLPPGVGTEPVDAAGVTAEWTIPDAADDARAVLYVHGGGFVAGSIASDCHLAALLAKETRARVLSLDYKRAPEHPFPAALDEVATAYGFLLDRGFEGSRIAVAGVSAGAALALGMLIAARDRQTPLPGCVWLASPWCDLTNAGASFKTHSVLDPVIQKSLLDDYADKYLGQTNPRHPLASPSFGDLHGLPALLVQVGAAETLLDDSLKLCRMAGTANVPVTLEVWPRMIHGFHLSYPELASARDAVAAAGVFIQKMTGADGPPVTP